jgi:hypothetical protein
MRVGHAFWKIALELRLRRGHSVVKKLSAQQKTPLQRLACEKGFSVMVQAG